MGYWWFIDDVSTEWAAICSHIMPRLFTLLPKRGCSTFRCATQLCQVIKHHLIKLMHIFKKEVSTMQIYFFFWCKKNKTRSFNRKNPCLTGQCAALGNGGGRSRCLLKQVAQRDFCLLLLFLYLPSFKCCHNTQTTAIGGVERRKKEGVRWVG